MVKVSPVPQSTVYDVDLLRHCQIARARTACARAAYPTVATVFGWSNLSKFLNSSIVWRGQVMPLPNTKGIMRRLETIIIFILKQLDLPLLSLKMKVFFFLIFILFVT